MLYFDHTQNSSLNSDTLKKLKHKVFVLVFKPCNFLRLRIYTSNILYLEYHRGLLKTQNKKNQTHHVQYFFTLHVFSMIIFYLANTEVTIAVKYKGFKYILLFIGKINTYLKYHIRYHIVFKRDIFLLKQSLDIFF